MLKSNEISKLLDKLRAEYPDAGCALVHRNVYELLVCVALSAQTTDVSVNKVSGKLFEKYPTPEALSEATMADIVDIIRSIGMYKTKSRNLIAMAKSIVRDFGGEVPREYSKLVSLPGVGRKTANVVLSVGFGEQRIAVDTHVFRVANRIGLVCEKDVLKTEQALMQVIPKERWTETHHSLIFHGRNCCKARNPGCDTCVIRDLCGKNI